MIGAPLSENYRIARTEWAELASLESIQAFLFGDGLNADFVKVLGDVKDVVST